MSRTEKDEKAFIEYIKRFQHGLKRTIDESVANFLDQLGEVSYSPEQILVDQKLLVASWMRWSHLGDRESVNEHFRKPNLDIIGWTLWNPDTDRKHWPELFKEIKKADLLEKFTQKVVSNVGIKPFGMGNTSGVYTVENILSLLEVEEPVLWKSLLEVLEEE